MKLLQKSGKLRAVIPLAGIVALSGCSYLQRPGEVCSTQQTYDALEKVIVSGAPSDGDAKTALAASLGGNFSPDAFLKLVSSYVSFKMPTVDAVDKDTGRVSCNGLLTLTGPQDAIVAGRGSDPDALDSPLPINDQSPDHIAYQISYSAQRTADGTNSAIILKRSPQVAAIVLAFVAKAESMKSTRQTSVASPVEQPVANQPDPDALPAQPAGSGNASDGTPPDADVPAPSGNLDASTGPDSHPRADFTKNLPQ
ncbi:hypothetical protein [uncultured Sphingomonas sp.]|uniref:hypothetical protein n=1 Tax=uncultured Sphingomonas sp. TaxID=158754 RepID=UPI002633ACE9|nr:hypothetical protein [uncultured Sphingomonas sp.]